MPAIIQHRFVKNASVRGNAKVVLAKPAPKSATQAKAGTRFLSYLISAFGAPNI